MSGITNGNPLTTGVTLAITSLLTSIIIVTLVTSAAGSSPAEVSWLVFASLLMTGITYILQAGRLGRIGTGHILVVSATGIYIAFAVQALEAGGLELLAILVVASALFQCFLSGKLSVLRHVITAKVTGTLLMLVPISVVPIIVPLYLKRDAQHKLNAFVFSENIPAPGQESSAVPPTFNFTNPSKIELSKHRV